MLFPAISANFDELLNLLDHLSPHTYSAPCPDLGGASVGMHYRHVIEMYLCLVTNHESGTVNYDRRERSPDLQSRPGEAAEKIKWLKKYVVKTDRKIILEQEIEGEAIVINSNYLRELLYNLEHSIHHQALIKIAVSKTGNIPIPKEFGIAHSTLAYQNRRPCAP